MSNDLNKCLFIGRLGADPEIRYMPNGKAVANFRIAVGSSWKDKQTGDKKEQTEWVSIVAFDKLGEICAEHLRKGSQVFIEGAMRTRKWQDKEGKDRYTTEIVAQSMQMLGGRPQGESKQKEAPSTDDFGDDIPFSVAFMTPLGSILAGLVLVGLVIAA